MKGRIIFKIGSILSLIGFFYFILLCIFVLMESISRIWAPNSAFAKSFSPLEPIFSNFDIEFYGEPALFHETGFIILNYAGDLITLITGLFISWWVYKLLKNIYNDSLFMYENVSVFMKLGMTIGIVGTIGMFLEDRLWKKLLPELDISNAQITNSIPSYYETIFSGIVLVLIALALQIAVHAVEENKKTI